MPARIDLTGHRYGRLTAIRREGARWLCRCECGNEKLASSNCLRVGDTRSCGCLNRERLYSGEVSTKTHGQSRSSEYFIWQHVKRRCLNNRCLSWPNYGGRGISVCDRWLRFENFLEDMGPRPSPRHSIDRIDNNGNYEPGNCRWATPREQCNNTRKNVLIEVDGRTKTIAEWSRISGRNYQKLWREIQKTGRTL